MKTAIVYSSKHGTTEKVAKLIAEKLNKNWDVTLISLNKDMLDNLSEFDYLILGTSCYVGRPMRKMVKFCKKHQNTLEQKVIGLYICGMEKKEKAKRQLEKSYPPQLHQSAKAEGFMGGEFLLENLKGFEPYVMKAMKITTPVHNINVQAIDEFVSKLSNEIKM